MSAQAARSIGGFGDNVVATGTTQADAWLLHLSINVVTGADGTNGVRLQDGEVGDEIWIFNASASDLNVYPESGGTITDPGAGAGTLNAAVVVGAFAQGIFKRQGSTQWLASVSGGAVTVDWGSPGAIGSVTPNSGVFTTLQATAIGGITPGTVASTTLTVSATAAITNTANINNHLTITGGGGSNSASIKLDSGATNGVKYIQARSSTLRIRDSTDANSLLTLSNTGLLTTLAGINAGGDMEVTGNFQDTGSVLVAYATAVAAGGSQSIGFKFSSTADFGIFFGSGAPTISAAQGSVYLRSDGSAGNNRMYVNTNGTTGWTNVTTAT